VGIGYRIADIDQSTEQLSSLVVAFLKAGRLVVQLFDRLLQGSRVATFQQTHRVEGTLLCISASRIDRENAGMLQPSGDHRLLKKPLLKLGVVRAVRLDFLERNTPRKILIPSDQHTAHAPLGQRFQHAVFT
jgi:hypothetical protein